MKNKRKTDYKVPLIIKNYIKDFVEDLNYEPIILSIHEVINTGKLEELKDQMNDSFLNHMQRLNYITDVNRMFYVENCDLQNITITELNRWNDFNRYKIYTLHYDEEKNLFYYIINIY